MELLISRQGEVDDEVQQQEIGYAVWKLGQVYIRIRGVTAVEITVQPSLASEAALIEAQRWVEALTPHQVILNIDETGGLRESFLDYSAAIERMECLGLPPELRRTSNLS